MDVGEVEVVIVAANVDVSTLIPLVLPMRPPAAAARNVARCYGVRIPVAAPLI